MKAVGRLLVLACSAWVPMLLGCAALGRVAAPEPEAEIRPGASADYDFLVARELELEGQLAEAFEAYARAAEKDPESAYLQRKLAELAARQGRFEEALEHAERAHALDPEDADARIFLGTLYRVSRDVAGAERVLRGADGQPVSPEAAALLLSIYFESDRLEDALAAAEWMIASRPDSVRSYLAAASVYERMGRPAEAERVLREALEQEPGNVAAYAALARSRRERGDREGEIAVYQELLERNPDHATTLTALSEAQMALGHEAEAIDTLRLLVRKHPDDLRALVRLGALEYETGRYAEAAQRFEEALGQRPQEYEFTYFLGLARERAGATDAAAEVLSTIPPSHERYADARVQLAAIHEQAGDYARAIEELEAARVRSPSRRLDFYLASLRARSGDFVGAVSFLEGLLQQAPGDDEVLYNLGVLYHEEKEYEQALRYMHLALASNPDNANALNFIGYTWAERGENLDQAERMIVRALELQPDDGYITDSLGWVYYQRALPLLEGGRVEDGRELLQRAASHLEAAAHLTDGDPVVSEHLGDVYLRLGRKRDALERYEEALQREPSEDDQPQLREKVERLRRELGGR
jgi:tetratricopeptide (TPR) repeat protein